MRPRERARVRISAPSGSSRDCKVWLEGQRIDGELVEVEIGRNVSSITWHLDAQEGIAWADLRLLLVGSAGEEAVLAGLRELELHEWKPRRGLLSRLFRRRPDFEVTRMRAGASEYVS